jgi:hypothetical protein
MRSLMVLLVSLMIAVAGAAGERFTLGLEDLPLDGDIGGSTAPGAGQDSLRDHLIVEMVRDRFDDALVYSSALDPRSEQEFRLALWSSPMGRLYYSQAAEESMLGRQGLVGGGRMQGIGLATGAIGDGDPGGLELIMKTKWSELSFSDKFQAGIEASIAAALIYYMATASD